MTIRFIAAAAALMLAAPASAQDSLSVAIAAGQVGERFDGYLGVVGTPTDALRRQVGTVNIKRRSLYVGLASRKGVTPEEVGLTAACTTLARVAVGQAYFTQAQGWQRRAPGQPAPVPAYCGN